MKKNEKKLKWLLFRVKKCGIYVFKLNKANNVTNPPDTGFIYNQNSDMTN